MIKLEHVVTANPAEMEFVIEGMRNPMNSWVKSDSDITKYDEKNDINFLIGDNDMALMQRLVSSGTDHMKFMRMIPVYVRITAPLYWWKEFDTYKVGTVANSCSTMHKIAEKEFTLDDFSIEHLDCIGDFEYVVNILNCWRSKYIQYDEDPTIGESLKMTKKDIWWQMIQFLPSSYNQTRNVTMNYAVLMDIYKSRKNHKLDEWRDFCKWIESLPYSKLIYECRPGF